MTQLYMLDTNICSFIMRERPAEVLEKLQACVNAQQRIVISAITYAEMRYGSIGKKASPKHAGLVSAFVARLDGVLPWDAAAVDQTTRVRVELAKVETPIGTNYAASARHARGAHACHAT